MNWTMRISQSKLMTSRFGLANSNSFTMATIDDFVLVVKVCTLITALHLVLSVFEPV